MNVIRLSPYDHEDMQELTPNGYCTTCRLYIPSPKKLHKILKESDLDIERERNINFLLNDERIPYTTYPTAKILINELYAGYEMDYLKGAKTFTECLDSDDITNYEKLIIIKNIFSALKTIHYRGAVLGDIHLDNFLVYQNNGYISDLDDLRFPGDEFKFDKLYNLRDTPTSPSMIIETKGTDNVKSAINCLSLIYGFDLLTFVKIYSISDLQNILDKVLPYQLKNELLPTFGNLKTPTDYFDVFAEDILKTDTKKASTKLMQMILKK